MNSKTLLIINIVLIAISIVGISGSSYGLGMNSNNQSSPGYQTASIFLTVSVFMAVFFIITLLAQVLLATGAVSANFNVPTSIPTQPNPYSGANQIPAWALVQK